LTTSSKNILVLYTLIWIKGELVEGKITLFYSRAGEGLTEHF
jgi:hypothetical protein